MITFIGRGRMKKHLLIGLTALLLLGCANSSTEMNTTDQADNINITDVSNGTEEIKNTTDAGYVNNSRWEHQNIAACEEGYYIVPWLEIDNDGDTALDIYGNEKAVVDGFLAFFYDLESCSLVPWCDRADCNHRNIYCNAFFEKESYLQRIYYYDGKVYMISKDEDFYYIESFDKDGSNQKKECRLKAIEGYETGVGIYFYNQYVYYHKSYNDETPGIYRRPVSDMSREELVIAFNEEEYLWDLEIYIVNDTIYYYVTQKYDDTGEMEFKRVNIDGSDPQLIYVPENEYIHNMTVTEEGDIYYYFPYKGLMRIKNGEHTAELLYEEDTIGYRGITYDGTYLYVENGLASDMLLAFEDQKGEERYTKDEQIYMMVFDKEGNLVDRLHVEIAPDSENGTSTFAEDYFYTFRGMGGDERVFLATCDLELIVFDKAKLFSDEQTWVRKYGLNMNGDFDFSVDQVGVYY
jgi:hypothetical protein